MRAVTPLIFLVLFFAGLVLPVFAQNVTTVENTSVIIAPPQYIDDGIFWFIVAFGLIFFVISLASSRFQDLFCMIATLLLGVTAYIASRVAHYEVFATLDPRIVNTSNMTVLQESSTRVQLVTTAYPEPLLQIVLAVLFALSFVNLLRVLLGLYNQPKEAWEERRG
jgi:hypothetical protein